MIVQLKDVICKKLQLVRNNVNICNVELLEDTVNVLYIYKKKEHIQYFMYAWLKNIITLMQVSLFYLKINKVIINQIPFVL